MLICKRKWVLILSLLLKLLLLLSFFSTHLLQRRVRHTKAAEADVQESFLQLPEEASISPGLEVTIGQKKGELLANSLDQACLGHMMMDQGCDAFHVTCR